MSCSLVVIGAGAGGERALRHLLAVLPGDFPVPVAVVANFEGEELTTYRRRLARIRNVAVVTATDKAPLEAGTVYLAPEGYHLLVDQGYLSLSIDPPQEGRRPAVDALFESAALSYGSRLVAVLLNGEGRDGVAGLRRVKHFGGLAVALHDADDPVLSKAVKSVDIDKVLPLADIAQLIIQLNMAPVRWSQSAEEGINV